ncbi:sulfotransferase [candidate division KSB1 bacterium]|nr:sulfotransferase [candidate division KSB1 bacterium]
MEKTTLDFLIIGAQKAGTTTLFRLLSQHESVYLPPEKEAPYFGNIDREKLGWLWYVNEFFSGGRDDQLWGSVTPQYMSNLGIAREIKDVLGDIKLVAILRDPVERAYSHFKMSMRRGIENRLFNQVICDLVHEDALDFSRQCPKENNAYIVWGEYGRILSDYCDFFDKKNILILFTEDLEKNPQQTLDKVCNFIGIKCFTPVDIGKKYHVGSSSQKLPIIGGLRRIIFLRNIWRRIVPFKSRRRFMYWFDQWNSSQEKQHSIAINDLECFDKLKNLYLIDIMILEKLFNVSVPWRSKLE